MIREMPSRDLTVVESVMTPAEPSLGDYLALIWRVKVFLIAAAILGGATMFALSISGPRVYESTVTFAATQSKIGQDVQGTASTASFRPIVESLTTAAAVLREVGLDRPPHNIRPSEFLTRVMALSEVRGTNLMRVTIVYTDPALAATMANSVADHSVRMARKVSATEAVHGRDMIKEQVDLARKRLDESDVRLTLFKRKAQIDAVKKDVDSQLLGRGSLLDLLVSIAGERSKLARMDQDLAKHDRIDTLKKTIDSEPVLNDAVRGAPGSGGTIGTQLRSESISEVYEELDKEAAKTRANLALLEKRKSELMDVRKLGAASLPALNHLYQLESELARLQTEYDLAQKIYTDVSQRHEVASLQVVGRSAELSVIDPAVPADRPMSRQVARNTVVGALAGLCLGLAGLLTWEAAGRRRPVPAG